MEIIEQGRDDTALVKFETPHAIITTWVGLESMAGEWIATLLDQPDAPIIWTLGAPFIGARVEFETTPEAIEPLVREAMAELESGYWDQKYPRCGQEL